MPKNKYLKSLIFKVMLLFCRTIFSQDNNDIAEPYIWFDSLIGIENTEINNGTVYIEELKTEENKNTHKFFSTNKYQLGNICYDNQNYFNVLMKYDLYEDQIIVKIKKKSNYSTIKLVQEKVQNFSINSNYFVNHKFFKNTTSTSSFSFYQILFESKELSLFKVNKKESSELIKEMKLYYEFNNKNFYYILYNDNMYLIKSKKDIKRIFPIYKKDIYSFYKKNKKLFKKDKNTFFIQLTEQIQKQLQTNFVN